RCPVRASALAYASLLALIPMLAVVVSVTSSILKSEGEERIDNFVVKLVSDLVPPGTLAEDESGKNHTAADQVKGTNIATTVEKLTNRIEANLNPTAANTDLAVTNSNTSATNVAAAGLTNSGAISTNGESSLAEDKRVLHARRLIARRIHHFIQNTR